MLLAHRRMVCAYRGRLPFSWTFCIIVCFAAALCLSPAIHHTLLDSSGNSWACAGATCTVPSLELRRAGAFEQLEIEPNRLLLESQPPSSQISQLTARVIAVTDEGETYRAAQGGAQNILVQGHLDMRIDFADPQTVLGTLKNSTESISGDCKKHPSEQMLSDLELPSSIDLKPGQCILAINTGFMVLLDHNLTMRNLYIVIKPDAEELVMPLPAIDTTDSHVWMSNMMVHNKGTEACLTLGCFLHAASSNVAIEGSSFKEMDFLGPVISVDPGTRLSISHSTVSGKHAGHDAGGNWESEEAWEKAFIVASAKTCVANSLIHDAFVRITETTFTGVPALAAQNAEGVQVYVWVDDPSALAMCTMEQKGRICDDPSVICKPATANSTQDVEDQPQFLQQTSGWVQRVLSAVSSATIVPFAQWEDEQPGAPALAPAQNPDVDTAPEPAQDAPVPTAQPPSSPPICLATSASVPEVATELEPDSSSSEQSPTKTALYTLAACVALLAFFVFMHRVTRRRKTTSEAQDVTESDRSWRIRERLRSFRSYIRHVMPSRAPQRDRIESNPPSECGEPTQRVSQPDPRTNSVPAIRQPRLLNDPPSESSAEDHDMPGYPALQRSQNLLPSQSAALAAWKDRITQCFVLKDDFQSLDLELTYDQATREFPTIEMLHANPELRYSCSLLLEDLIRNCILMMYANKEQKAAKMRCIAPPDENLRRLMPTVVFNSDNSDGRTFLGEHSALPLVLVADDKPLMYVGPDINWEYWRILEMAAHVGILLMELHDLGYVHRQVDHWSVRLVHYAAGHFEWRMHNFSLYRAVGESGPMAPNDAGTPPEHRRAYSQGKDSYVAHPAEDVWKLGLLLLKSLAESYKRKWQPLKIHHEEVVRAVRDGTPMPHEEEHPEDRDRIGPLEPVLLRCLDSNPCSRPSMREFLEELRPILDSMHASHAIPDPLPEPQDKVAHAEHAHTTHSATGTRVASDGASTSQPTQAASSHASVAEGSSACSPPASISDVLQHHISHIINSVCDGPPASGSGGVYPQSSGGTYFAPTSSVLQSQKPHPGSEFDISGTSATSSLGLPQSMMGMLLAPSNSSGGRTYNSNANGQGDSFDSTEAMPPTSVFSALSPPSSALGQSAQAQGRIPGTVIGAHGNLQASHAQEAAEPSEDDSDQEREAERAYLAQRAARRKREVAAAQRTKRIMIAKLEEMREAAAAQQQAPQHAANDEEPASIQLTIQQRLVNHRMPGAPLEAVEEEEHTHTHATHTTESAGQCDFTYAVGDIDTTPLAPRRSS